MEKIIKIVRNRSNAMMPKIRPYKTLIEVNNISGLVFFSLVGRKGQTMGRECFSAILQKGF